MNIALHKNRELTLTFSSQGFAMLKYLNSILPLICFLTATFSTSGIMAPKHAWASPNKAQQVNIISQLNELRDTISFNWALTLKSGWQTHAAVDDPKETKNNEAIIASLEQLFAASPQPAKITQLIKDVKELRSAEQKYSESLFQAEEAANKILLNSYEMAEAGAVVSSRTNAIVYDKKTLTYPEYNELNPEDIESWKKEYERRAAKPSAQANIDKSAELDKQTADTVMAPLVKEQLSSNDPDMLRLAYQAYQASFRFHYQLEMVTSDDGRAMYDERWPVPVHFAVNQESLARGMEAINKLPGLNEVQQKKLERIPQCFQEAAANIATFDNQLKLKKQAFAELELQVESVLNQIDELRSYHLNLLTED